MPPLRSGISRDVDTTTAWKHEVVEAGNILASIYKMSGDEALRKAFLDVVKRMKKTAPGQRADASLPAGYGTSNDDLMPTMMTRWRRCGTPKASARTMKSDGCLGSSSDALPSERRIARSS